MTRVSCPAALHLGRLLAVTAAPLLLGACALLPPGPAEPIPAPEPAPAAPENISSASASVAYSLEVDAPRDLRTLLLTYLDLARFQGAAQADSITSAELTRLANAAPAQARSLLETEGYFNAQVTIDRGETESGQPLLKMIVLPGPRSTIASVQLRTDGDLKKRAEAGEADALTLTRQLNDRWTLPPGEAFRQSAWNSAKNNALALLRAEGYPTASWGPTEAHVDAATQTVTLSGTIDSGPLFLLGELRIEGLQRYDGQAVRNIANFSPGTPYSERRLLDFQERLNKLRLFESVSVEIDPDPSRAAATPVLVRVRELSLQQATVGLGYSDKTRVRTTLEHRHRRPFGWNGQISNTFEIGTQKRSWEAELISDPTPRRYRNLIAPKVSREEVDDEITQSSRIRVGRSLDTERIERLIFGELLSSTLRNRAVDQTGHAISLNYNWVWRDVDNVVLPTEGLTSSIQVAVGYARSNFDNQGPFGRIYTRNTLYWPLGGSWYSQVRLEVGQIVASPNVGMPEDLLFRAGGDESVRGYTYRSLGPKVGDVVGSGRTLVTTSAEIAHPFTSRLPSLWWAAFIDAGNAAETIRDLSPVLGYGLGLRIRSPVGPLRIDLAYGQEDHKVRTHLSVGIAF
jgi:translocation and assembly module TamA